jgi:hypothetical protein
MGIHRGPNIVKDGLVFGYDTGYGVADNSTATRFYAGEPTNNFMPTLYIAGSNVTSGTDEIGDYKEGTITRIGCPNGTSINSGSTYTFTIELRSSQAFNMSADSNQYAPQNTGNDANRLSVSYIRPNYTAVNEWVTYSTTVVMKSGLTNPTMFDFFMPVSFTGRLYYRNAQLEYKAQRTPYVLGTRSSTASLIDLKRTTSIDVSNVSFDSTGQPTFDGSNDYISIDVDSWIRTVDSVTIEGVVIIPSGASLSGGPWAILTDHSTNSEKDGFWWHMSLGGGYTYFRVEDAVSGEQGITFSGATPFASGNTYHIATIVGLNSVKIYVNGVLSKSYTPTFNWANVSASHTASLFIGRTFPSYWLNSTNPVVKVYDVALTEAEIKQNYNSYKNRFDI